MDPDGFRIVVEISILIILIFFSALFSASETAFFSLNKIRMERLSLSGNSKAKIVYEFLKNPADLIATILIGNEMVNIAISSLVALLFIEFFGEKGAVYAVPTTVITLLVFGEVTPKTLAIKFNEKYSFFIVGFIKFLSILLFPFKFLILAFVSLILRPFGVELFGEPKVLSDEEFMILVEEGEKEGVIDKEEKELIDRTLDLDDSYVKEIMVPKHEIFALPESMKVKEALKLIKEKRFSRIPVYGKDIDDIKGVLFARRLIPLSLKKEDFDKNIEKFLDKPFFVPEFKEIDILLEEMQKDKKHLAVVVDEYGNTAGIVTLDDILSSLIGEIPDERGVVERDFDKVKEGVYRVNSTVAIDDFKDFFDITEETEEEKDIDTVGGLIMRVLDKVPKAGDAIDWQGLKITVEKMEGNRIKLLKVEKK